MRHPIELEKIVVLDYGSSNLRSVAKALETVAEGNHKITVTDKPKVILSADKVVFPGQGAIGQCMQSLKEKELDSVKKNLNNQLEIIKEKQQENKITKV